MRIETALSGGFVIVKGRKNLLYYRRFTDGSVQWTKRFLNGLRFSRRESALQVLRDLRLSDKAKFRTRKQVGV